MKKVINNKLFLIIVTAIICIGGTVTATVLYNANQISYAPKDSAWEASDVNTALDDLYTMIENKSYTVKSYNKTQYYYEIHGSGVVSFARFNLTDIPDWNNLEYGYNLFVGNSSMAFHECGSGGYSRSILYDKSTGILTIQNYDYGYDNTIIVYVISN